MAATSEQPLTLDDVLDDERDLFRIVRARQVARVMRRVGWFVVVGGLVSLGFTLYFMAAGEITGDDAVTVITTTILGTILTGVAAYGSGMGLTLAASNLARRMEQTAAAAKPSVAPHVAPPAGTSAAPADRPMNP